MTLPTSKTRRYQRIEDMALEAQAEIRSMAKAAQESINRSHGQHLRWHRVGIEQFKREHQPKAAPISLSAIVFDVLAYSLSTQDML